MQNVEKVFMQSPQATKSGMSRTAAVLGPHGGRMASGARARSADGGTPEPESNPEGGQIAMANINELIEGWGFGKQAAHRYAVRSLPRFGGLRTSIQSPGRRSR